MESGPEQEKDVLKSDETKRYRIIKYFLGAVALLIAAAFIVGMLYCIIDYYTFSTVIKDDDSSTTSTAKPTAETTASLPDLSEIYSVTQSSLLSYFSDARNDGINVVFYHGANSKDEMNAALNGNYDVLEADITLERYNATTVTEKPIMAHPPAGSSDNSLDEWMTAVTASNKVIKMDIKTTEVIPFALETLRSHVSSLHQPVWINADAVIGPNTNAEPIDPNIFVSNVNSIYPNVTLSLGWTTAYRLVGENEAYSWKSMDEMRVLTRDLSQPITFPARAALIRQSWDKFLWLLEQNDDYTLTIWTASSDPVETEDMVFVRDNFDVSKIFYDAYDALVDPLKQAIEMNAYPKVFYTGGNVLDYFRIPNRAAIDVTWAHRVNSAEELQTALYDDGILMLEADVRLYGEGTDQVNDSLPVMAHDLVDTTTGIALKDWLDEILRSNQTKGLKLDFKSTGALEAALAVLNENLAYLNMPIWLNSDVLRGPGSPIATVNATQFFAQISQRFPDCTLSPGWTTVHLPNGKGYTDEMVQEMYEFCSSARQAVTFPVRASLTRASIPQMQWLLSKSNRFSLTVWHSASTNEGVTAEDLLEIYNSFPVSKVFFDLPADMMDGLLQLIREKA